MRPNFVIPRNNMTLQPIVQMTDRGKEGRSGDVVASTPLWAFCVNLLALDGAWSSVSLAGVTSDGLDLLFLEILVGLLLPFAGHGLWWWPGELTDSPEEKEGDTDTGDCVEENLLVFTWRWESARSVRAKSNPVGYISSKNKK